MPYALRITFKSGDHLWTQMQGAYKICTDEEALNWARSMRKAMRGYTVTLFKDGVMMQIPEEKKKR